MQKTYSLICFFFTFCTFGQNTISIQNVEEVIAMALEENSDLNVYLLKQEQSNANYKKDKNFFLPKISGALSLQNNLALPMTALPGDIFGQPGELVNVQLGQQFVYNAGINLSKTILDAENKIKSKISGLNQALAYAQTEAFKQSLKEQAAFYYYTTLIGKQAVAISKEDLRISDSILTLTNQKFREGLIDKTSLNQARISKNNVQQNALSNQNIYYQSLNNLKLLLNIKQSTSLVLTEDILNPEYKIISGVSPDKNLNVVTLQKEQSELGIKQGKAAFIPKLSLNGYFGKQQLNDQGNISFEQNSWTDYSFLNVSASIPVFSGFVNKNKLKAAKIENEIAKQNLAIETQKISVKDKQLLEEYSRNRVILENSQHSYRLTKENADLAMQKYEQGLMSLDTYFKSYEDYLKSENNYLNTLSVTFTQYATLLSRQN